MRDLALTAAEPHGRFRGERVYYRDLTDKEVLPDKDKDAAGGDKEKEKDDKARSHPAQGAAGARGVTRRCGINSHSVVMLV